MNHTLSRKATVSFPAVSRKLDKIRPNPFVSLLEIIVGLRFRRKVRPRILQKNYEPLLSEVGEKREEKGDTECARVDAPIHRRLRYPAGW